MSSIPPSFDPHGIYHFTAGAATPYRGQSNAAYMPISSSPTSSQTSSRPSGSPQQASATSVPTQAHIHSPQPRGTGYPAQASGKPIFTPFRLERSSPELSDVLTKKGASVWPAHPSYVAQASATGNNGGRRP
ncbi:hypothetical protein BU17DRAFT_81479 [Hysterangium stoloniferum]|nr:hypothetical protein BU17DRAFT_81479 [Hysterangium stoloniferum]